MINPMTDFKTVKYFWMVTFPVLPLMGFKFLNLIDILALSSHVTDFF